MTYWRLFAGASSDSGPSSRSSPRWLHFRVMAKGAGKSVVRLAGRWRIVEMSGWDRDVIDLVDPGFIEFTGGTGQFGFIAVRGWLDCRSVERDGRIGVEFTWEGVDEGDQVSGRGWASLVDDETIDGHLFFHNGEDSSFRARPLTADDRAEG
jgi:hypothetical protein